MQRNQRIFFPFLAVSILLLIGVLVFAYDAASIVKAEESEEENNVVLLNAEHWLSDFQALEFAQQEFILTGRESYLAYSDAHIGRDEVVLHFQALREAIAVRYTALLPKVDQLAALLEEHFRHIEKIIEVRRKGDLSTTRLQELSEQSRDYLEEIHSRLDEVTAPVRAQRDQTNAQVSISVIRGSVSFTLMTLLLITILSTGYRLTWRTLKNNEELSVRLRYEATHDPLTHLPNRRYFDDWLLHAIAAAARSQSSIALLFIDLDEFKQVNDRYGHAAGDDILKIATRRLSSITRESDLLVRLGGDEFAILITNLPCKKDPSILAQRLIAALSDPITFGDNAIQVGASVGIAIYPRDVANAEELVAAADKAMYLAKQSGKNQYRYYADSEKRELADRHSTNEGVSPCSSH